jgi:hypothetical protein
MAQPTCGLSGFILACFARKYRSHRINPTRLILIPSPTMSLRHKSVIQSGSKYPRRM